MQIKEVQRKHKEAIRKLITKAPPIILHNRLNAPPEVFKEFQKKFLKRKKDLELDVIKQNKEVDKIGKLLSTTDEQERSRTRLSESAKSLVSHHKRRRKDEAERQRISSLK